MTRMLNTLVWTITSKCCDAFTIQTNYLYSQYLISSCVCVVCWYCMCVCLTRPGGKYGPALSETQAANIADAGSDSAVRKSASEVVGSLVSQVLLLQY